MKLSIIVPCYNEEKALEPYFKVTQSIIKNMNIDWEYVFVNDGSKDNTLNILLKLKDDFNKIKIIDFSRNFGKEAGILAGLNASDGDLVVIMDADLQDPPHLLPQMVSEILNNHYDSVATYRVDRAGEPPIRSFFARVFYKLINKISDVEIVDGARDYRMMNRDMVNAILSLSEYHRFSKGIFAWVGFKTKYLSFENVERVAGETKWSFWKLFKYAIEGIIAFTTVPLRISMMFGLLFSLVAFAAMVFVMIRAMIYGDPVAGWPSSMVTMLLLGGIQLLGLGIIGEYLSKTYMEVKRRPNYIVKKIYK